MASIKIYTTPTCPFCWAAKRLLSKKKVEFTEIDVAVDADKRSQMSELAGGANTVPQIWIDERHIGGSDDLHALEASGELDGLIEVAAEVPGLDPVGQHYGKLSK